MYYFGGDFLFFFSIRLYKCLRQLLARMCRNFSMFSLPPSTVGEDFNSFDVRTTLQPGLSSWHFNLDIINNRVSEPTKHFGISLSLLTVIPNARLSNAQLNVTIIDDDCKGEREGEAEMERGRERERQRGERERERDGQTALFLSILLLLLFFFCSCLIFILKIRLFGTREWRFYCIECLKGRDHCSAIINIH